MYNLKEETRRNINYFFENNFQITYDEYSKLDDETKSKLISNYKKNNHSKKNETIIMIGSGEHTIFKKVKKGEKIWVTSGDESFFTRAGITLEETERKLNDKIDDILYSKPVAFVKKLNRRIKK